MILRLKVYKEGIKILNMGFLKIISFSRSFYLTKEFYLVSNSEFSQVLEPLIK